MFNLEQAISNWRREFSSAGITNSVQLDELESHLREDVEREMRAGVSQQKAFEIASSRVGEAKALKAEFKRASQGRTTAEKLMIAIGFVLLVFIALLSGVTVFFCYPSTGDRIVGSVAIICSLLASRYWSWAVPLVPVVRSRSKRALLLLGFVSGGFAVGHIYLRFILPHFAEPYQGLVPAAGFWIMLPIALGFGLGAALDRAALKDIAV